MRVALSMTPMEDKDPQRLVIEPALYGGGWLLGRCRGDFRERGLLVREIEEKPACDKVWQHQLLERRSSSWIG